MVLPINPPISIWRYNNFPLIHPMQVLIQPLKTFLKANPEESQFEDFLRNYKLPQITPKHILHQVNLKDQSEPEFFYVRLMVQDIRENQYYYPLLVQKPINENSEFHFLKYGLTSHNSNLKPQEYNDRLVELMRSDQYAKVLLQRETLICTLPRYETKWMQQLKNQHSNNFDKIELVIEGKRDFKLGEVFNAVCYWEPKSETLYYIREVKQDQAVTAGLDPWATLLKENEKIDFQQIKEKLIGIFSKFSTKRYAQFLLYSLFSQESMFLSGQNFQPLIQELLPRVFRLKIKAPFKDSLFPYKNENSQLIQTQMQMTSLSTYVILDFTDLASNNNQVKIDQPEIDNLKALKIFVQDGTTIYRWEMGESYVKHIHNGVIVRGNNIIVPHFHLKDEKFTEVSLEELLKGISKEEMNQMRVYLNKARGVQSSLTLEDRSKIEEHLKKGQPNIPKDQFNLKSIMRVARLNAMSEGRENLTFDDYIKGAKLVYAEFLQK